MKTPSLGPPWLGTIGLVSMPGNVRLSKNALLRTWLHTVESTSGRSMMLTQDRNFFQCEAKCQHALVEHQVAQWCPTIIDGRHDRLPLTNFTVHEDASLPGSDFCGARLRALSCAANSL